MNYIALNIAFSEDEQAEILTAELADYPFESFETEDGMLKAYIPQERLADCKTEVDALLGAMVCRGGISPSKRRTGTPCGSVISRLSTSRGAC